MIIDLSNYKEVLKARKEAGIGLDETGDVIRFQVEDKTIDYFAYRAFLCCHSKSNSYIFRLLGLDATKFCKKAYHHTPVDGDFPEARENYTESVINVTYMLFQECEKHIINIPKIQLKALLKNSFLDEIEEAKITNTFKKLDTKNVIDEIPRPRQFVRAEPHPIPDEFQWDIVVDHPERIRPEPEPHAENENIADWLERVIGVNEAAQPIAPEEAINPNGIMAQVADIEAQELRPRLRRRAQRDVMEQAHEALNELAHAIDNNIVGELRRQEEIDQARPANDLEVDLPW